MLFELTPEVRLNTIQKAFRKSFPFLKIEFYPGGHKWYGSVLPARAINSNLRISQVSGKKSDGQVLEIRPWYRTGTVETLFLEKLGIHMQVFRRKGEHWIQTAGSDDLTIEEQNELGQRGFEDDRGSLSWARQTLL